MIGPRTLAQRLPDARLAALTGGIVSTIRPLFPDVEVRELPGKIDISDIIAGDVFLPPMIGITIVRIRVPIGVDGSYELPVDLAAFIVTGEQAIGVRSERREAIAYAIGLGLFEILADLDVSRWGVAAIGSPMDIELKPMVTSKSFTQGAAYYSLTWRQALKGFGTDPLARLPYTSVESIEDGATVSWPADLMGAPV